MFGGGHGSRATHVTATWPGWDGARGAQSRKTRAAVKLAMMRCDDSLGLLFFSPLRLFPVDLTEFSIIIKILYIFYYFINVQLAVASPAHVATVHWPTDA